MSTSGALTETLSCQPQALALIAAGTPLTLLSVLHYPANALAVSTTGLKAQPTGVLSAGSFTSPSTPFQAYVPTDSNHWWGDAFADVSAYGGTATLTLRDVTALDDGRQYAVHGSAEVTLPGNPDGGTTGTVALSATF
jgi:hypothetical protein